MRGCHIGRCCIVLLALFMFGGAATGCGDASSRQMTRDCLTTLDYRSFDRGLMLQHVSAWPCPITQDVAFVEVETVATGTAWMVRGAIDRARLNQIVDGLAGSDMLNVPPYPHPAFTGITHILSFYTGVASAGKPMTGDIMIEDPLDPRLPRMEAFLRDLMRNVIWSRTDPIPWDSWVSNSASARTNWVAFCVKHGR